MTLQAYSPFQNIYMLQLLQRYALLFNPSPSVVRYVSYSRKEISRASAACHHVQCLEPFGSWRGQMIHGNFDQDYDLALPAKRRDASSNPKPSVFSMKSTSSSSEDSGDKETKEKQEGFLRFGPWGGTGGAAFDEGTYTGIRQVNLSRNVGIVSIRVCYDRDGQAVWGNKHGGTGGIKHDKIIFDYPSEILTYIVGTFGPLMRMGPNVIKSLTFYTNKGKHGPFGEEQGPSFTCKMDEGRTIGFHGREGLFLDAIGVYLMEGKVPVPPPPKPPLSKITAEKIAYGVVNEHAPRSSGPWGGDGGKPWDDGVFHGIKQIYINKAVAICSIQIEYYRYGSIWSIKHGGHGGTTTHRVKLDYPYEVLIGISGHYGLFRDKKTKVMRSLMFHTSKGIYGPFGEEIGTYFASGVSNGKVVGFHGRSGMFLDAIGVHGQPLPGNPRAAFI